MSSVQEQSCQMRFLLSAETRPYLADSVARVGRSFRNSYSDKHSSGCQTCNTRTCHLQRMSIRLVEPGPGPGLVVVGTGPGKQDSHRTETVAFADRMAHKSFVLAQRALADRPGDRIDCCTGNWIEKVVKVLLVRLARCGRASKTADSEEVSLELVSALGGHQSEPEVLAAVVLVEEQL